MSDKYVIVFNPGLNPVRITEHGQMVHPSDWAIAKEDFVSKDIDDARLLLVDPDTIGRNSNETVILLKKEAARLNEALDEDDEAEAEDADAEKAAPAPAKKTAAKKQQK